MKNETDRKEEIRMDITDSINSKFAQRKKLEQEWGQVWDTEQLTEDFKVISFLAPYVFVERKADQKQGTMLFQHFPRYYFSFEVS